MAKHEVKTGMTDYSALVYIPDPASTDGSGKTGLVAADLTVSYIRVETDNDVTIADATGSLNNLAALTTVHTDWGLLEVSSSLAPGLYRLDFADAVFASGAWSAVVYVMITSSAAAASPMEFVMVPDAPITGVNVSQWNALTTVALPLIPTVAGRTLDVSAGGEAGVDWANVGSPTTTNALTGTTTADLTTSLTESYAADGAAFTAAQALYEICQSLTEFAIASTTLTVKKRDGSTTAATFTLDSSTAPTSRTRAS